MNDDANFKPGPRAEVIKDSFSEAGVRVTTMEVTLHRFVLAELNTHRVFSRNSASSRAIPFRKQVARIMNSPAIPLEWRAEQRGMQGGDLLSEDTTHDAEIGWLHARNSAVQHAQHLADLGVHKSIVNRILEPFMWHTVIITATDWDGFWEQRCSPLAQPEIRVAATLMKEAYDASIPEYIEHGWWHMPYVSEDDSEGLEEYFANQGRNAFNKNEVPVDEGLATLMKVSAARCARVSYLTHDGQRSIDKDVELYDRLVSADPMHASPLEHVCAPAQYSELRAGDVLGNLRGWHQMRHTVERAKFFNKYPARPDDPQYMNEISWLMPKPENAV